MIRRLTLYALTVLLMGWGGVAFATVYEWSPNGSTIHIFTSSPACDALAAALYERYNYSPPSGYVAYKNFTCGSGATPWSAVGDSRLVGYLRTADGTTWVQNSFPVVLVSVSPDPLVSEGIFDTDVSQVSIQRVLLLVGWCIAFGFGCIFGKS